MLRLLFRKRANAVIVFRLLRTRQRDEDKVSEEQRREAEQAQAEAKLSAEKFEKVFQATEPKQVPTGRRPEDIPHREIPVENLPRRIESQPKPEKKKKGRTLRDAIRDRYRPSRQPSHIKNSRGSPVFVKGKIQDSSGRISTELNPQKAERLAQLREYVRAFQNRKELKNLEQAWRRTRAQRSHDPELRP